MRDSYLEDFGLKNMGAKNTIVAYFKIMIVFPFMLFWNIFKFLFNPKKSVVRIFKRALVFPLLEFFTGKNTSEKVLEDYTYFHQSILKKEVFNSENIKLNFEAHKSILLNSKIATILTIFGLLFLFVVALDLVSLIQLMLVGLAFVSKSATAIIGFITLIVKILLTISLFAVEMSMLRSLFITEKSEIKDYLDEIIFYADTKNQELFGDEHAKKVKDTLYEAYLTEKSEIVLMETTLIDEYLDKEVKQISVEIIEADKNENADTK